MSRHAEPVLQARAMKTFVASEALLVLVAREITTILFGRQINITYRALRFGEDGGATVAPLHRQVRFGTSSD